MALVVVCLILGLGLEGTRTGVLGFPRDPSSYGSREISAQRVSVERENGGIDADAAARGLEFLRRVVLQLAEARDVADGSGERVSPARRRVDDDDEEASLGQSKESRRKRTCLFNGGMSHSCDYKDVVGAAKEASYWNSDLSPGRKKRETSSSSRGDGGMPRYLMPDESPSAALSRPRPPVTMMPPSWDSDEGRAGLITSNNKEGITIIMGDQQREPTSTRRQSHPPIRGGRNPSWVTGDKAAKSNKQKKLLSPAYASAYSTRYATSSASIRRFSRPPSKTAQSSATGRPDDAEDPKSIPRQPPAAADGVSSDWCSVFPGQRLVVTIEAAEFDNMAIVVIVVCAWKIVTNGSHHDQLREVYYGVQIAYLAVLGTQIGLVVLSVMLLIGILKEYVGMVSPWVLGCILFMAVEAVCTVYANVLRDQVNREFDALCRAEVAFFLTRVLLNSLAIVAVLRFYRRLRDGFSWQDPEEIEL